MFKKKVIKVTLKLNDKEEAFTVIDGEKMRQVGYEGLRVSCVLAFGNGAIMPTAQVRIFGLPMEKIDKVTRIHWNTEESLRDLIKIEIGNMGEKLRVAFQGAIAFAYPDLKASPDVALVVEAQTGLFENLKPAPPYTAPEGEKLQDIIEIICKRMGYNFENNGVNKTLGEVALFGSDLDKIKQLCTDNGVDYSTEHGLISISPKGQPRKISKLIISPHSGLLGYPTPNKRGVTFTCLYDAMIRLHAPIEIKDSLIKRCNGEWRIIGAKAFIESNVPNGLWSMDVNATRENLYGV